MSRTSCLPCCKVSYTSCFPSKTLDCQKPVAERGVCSDRSFVTLLSALAIDISGLSSSNFSETIVVEMAEEDQKQDTEVVRVVGGPSGGIQHSVVHGEGVMDRNPIEGKPRFGGWQAIGKREKVLAGKDSTSERAGKESKSERGCDYKPCKGVSMGRKCIIVNERNMTKWSDKAQKNWVTIIGWSICTGCISNFSRWVL